MSIYCLAISKQRKSVKLLSLDSYHKSRVNTLSLCLFSINRRRKTSILPQIVAMGTPKIHIERIHHGPKISCMSSYVHVLLLLILSVPSSVWFVPVSLSLSIMTKKLYAMFEADVCTECIAF